MKVFSRKNNGDFVVRIEDTDQVRLQEHATEIILQGFTAELQILDPRTPTGSNNNNSFDEEYYNSLEGNSRTSGGSDDFIEEVINDDIPF